MRRALLSALLLAAGCDITFDLDAVDPPPPDGPPPFDACAAQPIDRAVRYAFVASLNPFIQSSALDACEYRGMDLVSINDAAEYAALEAAFDTSLMTGYVYIGHNDLRTEGTWLGSDGCAVHEQWSSNEPTGSTLENCVAIDNDGMFDGPCYEATGGFSMNRNAACEVGRWTTEACLSAALTPGELTFDPTPRTLDDAIAFCAQNGASVIEIESSAELANATNLAAGTPFWLGARHTERHWDRASGIACPQILAWRSGQPTFSSNTGCAAQNATGAEVRACSDQLATICER